MHLVDISRRRFPVCLTPYLALAVSHWGWPAAHLARFFLSLLSPTRFLFAHHIWAVLGCSLPNHCAACVTAAPICRRPRFLSRRPRPFLSSRSRARQSKTCGEERRLTIRERRRAVCQCVWCTRSYVYGTGHICARVSVSVCVHLASYQELCQLLHSGVRRGTAFASSLALSLAAGRGLYLVPHPFTRPDTG